MRRFLYLMLVVLAFAVTVEAQPGTPPNFTAQAGNATQINLNWGAASGSVANYLIERCAGVGCSNFAQIATRSTTCGLPAGYYQDACQRQYQDTGRTTGTSYSYRIRAQDAMSNNSGYSTTATATPGLTCATDTSLGWHDCGPSTLIEPICYADSTFANACKVGITAYSGGIFDTRRNRLVIFGGGHTDYNGDETYEIPLGTLVPKQISPQGPGGCDLPSCDGGISPNSRHTYSGQVYLPNQDMHWDEGGAPAMVGTGLAGVWGYKYDAANPQQGTLSQWTNFPQLGNSSANGCIKVNSSLLAPIPPCGPGQRIADVSCWDSSTGRVWVFDGEGTWWFDPSDLVNNNWHERYWNENGFVSGYVYAAACDTSRHRMWLSAAAGFDPTHLLTYVNLDDNTGNNRNVWSPNPTNSGGWLGCTGCEFIYDQQSTHIFIYNNDANGAIYEFNPDTNTSTTFVLAGTPPPLGTSCNGNPCVFGRWNYSPTLDAFVLLPSTSSDLFVLRFRNGTPDTQAPTAPSSLTATRSGSYPTQSVNLAWTASTDNVGVTGYFIERCTGFSCSNFAQITGVGGVTFNDANVVSATWYGYRVRATDGSGNLSGYSNVATVLMDSSGDVTPPTAPTSLTCPIVSYRSSICSWTASTDANGVTSYSLEHCVGVGCSNYVVACTLTGAPPVTTCTEYTLIASTSYNWRVRASDAAGNLSGYSNVVTATTQSSTFLQVGNDKPYTTLGAAYAATADGDHITLDYNTNTLPGTTLDIARCITIEGVGPPGTFAALPWDGGTFQGFWNQVAYGARAHPIPNDQGIIRIFANCVPPLGVNLLNLELSGAYVVDNNGAGIRYNSNSNLTVTNLYIHDNEDGILTSNNINLPDGTGATLIIQNSTLARNGGDDGSSSGFLNHNAYIGFLGHLIFRYNKTIDAREGHTFKSRAKINEIYSNFIGTKDSNGCSGLPCDGSLEINLPNGGDNYVIGNVIEQGTNTSNSSIIASGEENSLSGWNPTNRLYFENNTIFNYRGSGTFFQITTAGGPALTFVNQNNILANGGTLYSIASPTLVSNNNTTATSADFLNSAGGSYSLVTGASEINAGVAAGSANGISLVPATVYVDPANSATRTTSGGAIDIGAYEFLSAGSDTTAPIAGNGGTLATSVVGSSTLTLSWTRGSDVDNLQPTLVYEVCVSTSNNITSVANCEANGTIVKPFTADIESFGVTGLTANTAYFFNVVVADLAGNKTAYVPVSTTMRPPGRAGRIRARGGK